MTDDNDAQGVAPHSGDRDEAARRAGRYSRAADQTEHPTRAAHLAAQANAGVGRAYGLTALGTVLPGAGLIATKRRLIGVPMLAVALVTGAIGLYYVIRHGALRSALDLAARPDLLRVAAIVLAVAAIIWISSVVLTALTARPNRMTGGQRVGLSVFTGIMCLLIAAPTVQGLPYIDAHNDAVETIFTGADQRSTNEGSPSVGPAVGETDPWADVPRVNAEKPSEAPTSEAADTTTEATTSSDPAETTTEDNDGLAELGAVC